MSYHMEGSPAPEGSQGLFIMSLYRCKRYPTQSEQPEALLWCRCKPSIWSQGKVVLLAREVEETVFMLCPLRYLLLILGERLAGKTLPSVDLTVSRGSKCACK